jgi:hypothetical protein
MKTKSDHLIKELVADLKPVQIVRFQFVDLLKVTAVGLLCVFAAITILGLRVDIGDQALSAKFIFDTVILLLLGVLSIMAAFSLSVPSLSAKSAYRLPLFVFGLIILATGYSFITTSNPFLYLGHGFSCVYEIIGISILPAAILFYFVRRAAVLRRDIVGLLVLMSGVSFGLLGTQFTCVDSTPMHIIIWHILPTAIVMSFGVLLSRRLIKKM